MWLVKVWSIFQYLFLLYHGCILVCRFRCPLSGFRLGVYVVVNWKLFLRFSWVTRFLSLSPSLSYPFLNGKVVYYNFLHIIWSIELGFRRSLFFILILIFWHISISFHFLDLGIEYGLWDSWGFLTSTWNYHLDILEILYPLLSHPKKSVL